MYYFHSIKEAEEVFKALSTPVRIEIMELISENDHMSMNDLASALGVTNSAITMHVGKLESAGLVTIETVAGKRGTMKLVRPKEDRLLVDLGHRTPAFTHSLYYLDDVEVGCFTSIEAHPTCGIATPKKIIGELDNPKVFTFPDRIKAGILWIGYGSISYTLPNRLRAGQVLRELQLSFEISSECPEFNADYPSDIHLALNGTPIGKWISPGDFGDRAGLYTPVWWPEILNQYGLLKTIVINDKGTFMDGDYKLSDVTIDSLGIDYNSQLDLTFSVPKDTPNCGGMTLFGESFGDYNQGIRVRLIYEEKS